MNIYNSLTGKKERLEDLVKDKIKLFVCGPTVYDEPHLGHARVAVFFDFVRNYLKSLGYKVNYLQNITDIDDKIINRAHEEKIKPAALAKKFEKGYLSVMKALGINGVKYARASTHIKEIIQQIQNLIDKKFAYKTSSGVYFEVRKFPDYGKLSKQNLEELRAGWRIEPDPEKKDPMDFALWKFKKHNYEPSWKSPFGSAGSPQGGEGRPGWHIEDTAITEHYFGPQYDLHGGGMDLKFPHHESEIAQQEAVSGLKPFVKLWMHVGFLMVNGEKMSKSLKNFTSVNHFLKQYSAQTLRFMFLQNHYRSPLDYNDASLKNAESALNSIKEFLAKLSMAKGSENYELGIMERGDKKFNDDLTDDFNTPAAIGAIFQLINEINPKIWSLDKINAKNLSKWVSEKLKTLGISIKLEKVPTKIFKLAKERELFRSSKQFDQADALRKEIEGLGYSIEDTPNGPLVLKK